MAVFHKQTGKAMFNPLLIIPHTRYWEIIQIQETFGPATHKVPLKKGVAVQSFIEDNVI